MSLIMELCSFSYVSVHCLYKTYFCVSNHCLIDVETADVISD